MNGSLGSHWRPLAALAAGLALLVLLLRSCERQPDVNQELARTARVAVEMATRVQQENAGAYLWPGRSRMIAVVLGVAVPTLVAGAAVLVIALHRPRRRRPKEPPTPPPPDEGPDLSKEC